MINKIKLKLFGLLSYILSFVLKDENKLWIIGAGNGYTYTDQFFHGVGVDGVYLPFHKANQFLGMEPLPTFIANDVIKMPDVPRYTEEYRKHLVEIFG